jgi:PKD repeat protein
MNMKNHAMGRRWMLAMWMLLMGMANGLSAQAPILGTYANTVVVAGQNTMITPSAAPTNTSSMVAYTHTSFTGLLHVNPGTGVLTVTDAKQAGSYTVTIRAFGPGGSSTQTMTLTVTVPNCSQGLFSGTTNVAVGTNPYSVAIGDFNGDGKQDFAAANYGSANVSIRLGDGVGGFSGTTDIAVGTNPRFVAIGDFNGDGKQDFACANMGSGTVSIRLGDGFGGFSGTTNIAVGTNPNSVAIGDFNNDGNQDLVTSNLTSNNASIRLGNGLGGFSGTTNIAVGSNPRSVAVGDFDGDGKQDFAFANSNSNTVSIGLGDGVGGFSVTTTIAVGNLPLSVVIGDFNGDGKQDFAAGNGSSNNVSIGLGDGSGGFSATTTTAVGGNTQSVAIGDFNGDGKQDFAAASTSLPMVSIRLGDGAGGFSGTTSISPLGNSTVSVAIGDFNGDGRQDFAAANFASNNVSIRLGGENDIDVLGNAVSIVDGDLSPSLGDHTDFGVVPINTPLTRTYTISNTGTTALTIPLGGITLAGTDASMFVLSGITLPATVAAGGSTTFVVTFTPTSTGTKTATLNIANNDCEEAPYTFALQGGQLCDFSTCVGKTLTFTAGNTGTAYDWSFGDGGTSNVQNPTYAYAASGQYTVTFQLTDANGCITTTTQVVCVYDAPVVTSTSVNPLCSGASNGAIDISVTGGAPGTTFTYAWSNGATTQDLSGLAAGIYTVTVTDPTTTCFEVVSVTLTEPAVLAASASVGTNVLCFGASTGTATVTATGGTGPYSYAWTGGQTTATATGLAAGTYTVTVTDANGCATTASATVGQPAAALAATETHVDVLCFGNSTGSVDLSVSGGTSPYTYAWSNGAATEDLSGLGTGTYTVTVTDANGCTTTASATVSQPAAALVGAPSNSGSLCAGLSTANVLSNASGGTPAYTYLWTPGNITTQDLSNVGAGTYIVTVTDANGCTATGSTTIGSFPVTPATFIIGQ